jgi:hypothetical protein
MVTMKNFASAIVFAMLIAFVGFSQNAKIVSGTMWKDDQGNDMQVHDGGMIKVGNIYYWYGENGRAPGCWYGCFNGISCYSTTDFKTWHNEGLALKPATSGTHLTASSGVGQRPKVLYNKTTKTYVMQVGICCPKPNDPGEPMIAWCTSTSPTGPFTYVRSSYGANNDWIGDNSAFVDDDGTGYLIHSGYIEKLSADYMSIVSRVCQYTGNNGCNEAPAICKKDGVYYLYDSWCSYWNPNQGHYYTATNLAGPWTKSRDICVCNGNTFNSQGTYILQVAGTAGTTYIYIGDRWSCEDMNGYCSMKASKYVWLPLKFGANNSMSIDWYDTWYLDAQKGTWSTQPTSVSARQQVVAASHISDQAFFDIHGRKVGEWPAGNSGKENLTSGGVIYLAVKASRMDDRRSGNQAVVFVR